MKPVVSVQIIGTEIVLESLKQIGGPKTRKALRRGFTKAARKIAAIAKSKVVKETGLLKKSIGFRVYTNKQGGVGAVIGPRKGFKEPLVAKKRGGFRRATKKEKTEGLVGAKYRNPTRYAHLVEFGTSRAEARPFLRPAFEATKYEAVKIVGEEVEKAMAAAGTRD